MGIACKFLLIPRADVVRAARPLGAVIVDACRSLLISRLGLLQADASASAYPTKARVGRRAL